MGTKTKAMAPQVQPATLSPEQPIYINFEYQVWKLWIENGAVLAHKFDLEIT